jgi:peptidyl-prolyl cis-trans isomerase A (cyclophilin A)
MQRAFKKLLGCLLITIVASACGDDEPSGSGSSDGGAASSAIGSGGAVGASGPGGDGPGGAGAGAGGSSGGAGACDDVAAPDEELADATDPEAGDFTLDEALVELPAGPGPLRAIVQTEHGTIECELFPDEAPVGVANFVGLARGRRAWKDPATKKWVRRRFYDGLTFHRIIDDFVVQGGDPLGTGFGGPGYQFADEISDLQHIAGTLAYANSGANTNGSQFYIAETPQPALDGGYTVFGLCQPLEVIEALAAVATGAGDKPIEPVHTQTVRITRCAPSR